MENLERLGLFNNIYKDKTVFITGHTGFKGSWLALWLKQLGANIIGFSKDMHTSPSHIESLNLKLTSIFGDIRDYDFLKINLEKYKPDIIFHLAAQALVGESYTNPKETFDVNISGLINLLESSKKIENLRAVINVTSDKCYYNDNGIFSFREDDKLGGYDPYSCSKSCSELITLCYRHSFFSNDSSSNKILIATARAGNVIGGGDWNKSRLITDIIYSIINKNTMLVRNPEAIRPWQHVLDVIYGYLLLGEKLLKGDKNYAEAWNFGPTNSKIIKVKDILKIFKNNFKNLEYVLDKNSYYEAGFLKLDSLKAQLKLNWQSLWDIDVSLVKTCNWYKEYLYDNKCISLEQLKSYIKDLEGK